MTCLEQLRTVQSLEAHPDWTETSYNLTYAPKNWSLKRVLTSQNLASLHGIHFKAFKCERTFGLILTKCV